MRRVLLVATIAALAVIVVIAFSSSVDDTAGPTAPDVAADDNEPPASIDQQLLPADQTPTETEPARTGLLPHPLVPANARAAHVVRLADGDSFDIEWSDSGERDELRLNGINAPETFACFGGGAREVLDILIGDEDVLVDGIDRDDFGRVIADVWIGDLFVNATLVELGAALMLSSDGPHAPLIAQAQELASTSQQGLWNPETCGADQALQVRIVAIEADAPGQDNLNPNGEWIDIANKGALDVELTGWTIRDESTRHRFAFPAGFTLGPRSAVRVRSGCGQDTSTELFWCDGDPVWNNRGDTGFLVDPEGRFADTLNYSS